MAFEIFFGEDGCDQWIVENLQLPERGFFVDCGCAHPERYSQTAFLRARGWRGLAIDGNPAYASEWQNIHETTFVNAVLSDKNEVNFFIEPTNSLVSRVHPEGHEFRARMLSSILREYGVHQIDFLAIDIEGSEKVVLAELFTTGVYPRVLIAEYNSEHAGRDSYLIELVIRNGYDFVHMTNSNGVFVSNRR